MLAELRPFIDYNPFTSFYHFWKDFFTMNESPMYQIFYILTDYKNWGARLKHSDLDFLVLLVLAVIGAIAIFRGGKFLMGVIFTVALRTPVLAENE